jgi:hypothetical protein
MVRAQPQRYHGQNSKATVKVAFGCQETSERSIVTVVTVRMAAATSLYFQLPFHGAFHNSLDMFRFRRVSDCNGDGVNFMIVGLHVCELIVVFAGKSYQLLWDAFEQTFLKTAAGHIPHFCKRI